MATQGTVGVTEGSGKNLDMVQLALASGQPVQREMVSVGDPSNLDARQAVIATVPHNDEYGAAVRQVGEDIWNVSYSDVGTSVLASDFTLRKVGTGVGYSQAVSALLITTGTTANQEWLARSNRAWQGALALTYSTVLSQRILQNNFTVMLADLIGENLQCTINGATSVTINIPGSSYSALNVGQFMMIGSITGAAGVPGRYAIASVSGTQVTFTVASWPASGSCTVDVFGHSYSRVLYTGTTATLAAFDTQRRGWQITPAAPTMNTTASPGHIAQVHNDGRHVYLADTLRASTTTPLVALRASSYENLPDDNLDLYLFIWSYNGTSNPATTTTWTISFTAVEKFANLPVYVQGQRMQGSAAPAPVTLFGSSTVTLASTTITTLTPGTAAANLGKAEDAAAASGDTGVAMLAVRQDQPPANANVSANNDYATLFTDNYGRLWTNPAAFQYTHIAANGNTIVKAAPGAIGIVCVNTKNANGNMTIYDNTTATGTVIAVVDTTVSVPPLTYYANCANGIAVNVSVAVGVPPDITVSYV